MWWSMIFAMGCGSLVLGDDDIGVGRWVLRNMENCPDNDQYPIKFETKLHKMNRTHDAISAKMNIPEMIDEAQYGCYIEVCKKVDGGCKLQYQFNEASFCTFVKQYAEANFLTILRLAGIEPLDCPVPKGEWNIKDFILNTEEFPDSSMYGKFTATAFLTKGSNRMGCHVINLEFNPLEDEGDDEE